MGIVENPHTKLLIQWLLVGDTEFGKNTNVLLHLHVVKSILI